MSPDATKTEGTRASGREIRVIHQDNWRVSNWFTDYSSRRTTHMYALYSQRIDLFGAAKQDLPEIWEELGHAGFESGHAYGKALRTVKSCVGTTWCRYGVGDSVGLAVQLEERYKGIRAPHKFKGGVSGCVRECAEAQGKGADLYLSFFRFSLLI